MGGQRAAPDALTSATVTIAWVVLANKPFYPLYVWWLVGNGVLASSGTLIGAPFFAVIVTIAKRHPLSARLLLPLVGTLDTLFETKLFGQASGTALFLAPCIMLAALSFKPQEKWWQRGMALFVFLAFLVGQRYSGAPIHLWSDADLSVLRNLNSVAVASLMTFIGLRYAGLPRQAP